MSIRCGKCGAISSAQGWCLGCAKSYVGPTDFCLATQGLSAADKIKATLLLNGIPAATGSKEGRDATDR